MGWRFFRRVKIAPGINVNVTPSGVSATGSGPGYAVNVGKHGVTQTVGAPGTGLSHRSRINNQPQPAAAAPQPKAPLSPLVPLAVFAALAAVIWAFL